MSIAARLGNPGVLKMFLDAGFDVHVINSSAKKEEFGPAYNLREYIDLLEVGYTLRS